jgi:hypothetical protein
MPKPKGGRGYKAPYETHQVRIPDPIAAQVHSLIERYQDHVASGGDAQSPPMLLDQKLVDNFRIKQLEEENTQLQNQLKLVNKFNNEWQKTKSKAYETLRQALTLKANAGGAIKREIEKVLPLLH